MKLATIFTKHGKKITVEVEREKDDKKRRDEAVKAAGVELKNVVKIEWKFNNERK